MLPHALRLFASAWLLAPAALLLLLSAPVKAQSLLEMVETASGYDAQWRATLAERDAVARQSDQARAPLLPQLGLASDLSRTHTRANPAELRHTGTTASAALVASQSLYRPADRIQYQQSQLALQSMQYQLDAAAQDLVVRVAQSYFDVLAAQDMLGFTRAQKASVEQQLAAARRHFEVGTATITDAREAQARFDLIHAQEIAAENNLQIATLALNQTVGVIHSQPWTLRETAELPSVQPENVLSWVSEAETSQPQVRRAMLALKSARMETGKARTGHLPAVDLRASLGQTNNPNGTTNNPSVSTRSRQASISIELNMPLFSGFAVENRVRETVALEQNAQALLDDVRRQTAQRTREAYFNLLSGISQVGALQAAEASALSALEANQLGYQVGVRINLDVLDSQSQLFDTRRQLAQARYNVLMSHLRLNQASGTLDMDDVRRINALLDFPAPVPASAPAAAS